MRDKKEAIVLSGGLGTRLRPVVKDIPKPMADVNGKPFLHYLFLYLKNFGYQKVVLAVGYKSDVIVEYFGNEYLGIEIVYAYEKEPLGTGGGIRNALLKTSSELVLILNGDTFFDVDLDELENFHHKKEADCSIALREVNDASRYGTVVIDENDKIIAFAEKSKDKSGQGFINGGVYLLEKEHLSDKALPEKFSMEKEYFESFYRREAFYGYCAAGYFIDIGIPEDYYKAQNEFKGFKYG